MDKKDTTQRKGDVEAAQCVERPLSPTITDAQRDYVLDVRQWLRESMQDKTRIVGGPI